MAGTTYELEGVCTHIGEELVFSEGRFKKKEFVVTVTTNHNAKVYEDPVVLEAQNDGLYQISSLAEGNKIKVLFVIQGREGKDKFVGRYFNTLKAIKVDVLEATTTQQRAANTAQADTKQAVASYVSEQPAPAPQAAPNLGSDPDDLPF